MQGWVEIKTVFVKELTEILRNKRILISAFLIPLMIIPLVFGGMNWLQGLDREKTVEAGFRVVLPPDQTETEQFISDRMDIPVVFIHSDDVSHYVLSNEADVGLITDLSRFPERVFWLYFVASDDTSLKAQRAIKKVFETHRSELISVYLEKDLSGSVPFDMHPTGTSYVDVASVRDRSGHRIAKILPFVLVMILVSGCSFAAVDLIAGEKERGCLETLLVSPIRRTNVIIGKMLIVILTALTGLGSNMLSLFITIKLGFFNLGDDPSFAFSIGWETIVAIVLCALPLTVLFASTLMLVSARAKTYQSGQTLLMPFTLLAMIPALPAILPGMRSDSILMFVPIANVVLSMREMLEGSFKLLPMVTGNLVNIAAAFGLVILTVKTLNREGTLVPGSSSDSDMSIKAFQKDPVKVVFIGFVFVWLVMFYIMAPLQADNLVIGLLLTLWILIFGTGLLLVRFQSLPFKTTLSLKNPGWNGWIGAAVFQVGFLPLILYLNSFIMKFMPVPERWLEQFSDALMPDVSTAGLVFLMAISPGIAEEVLFRGAILGSLRRKWPVIPSILVSSILFGFLHFSVYRLFGTTMIGLALGWMVLVTGSIYPAMLAHALNNALVLVVFPKLDMPLPEDHTLLLFGIPFVIAGYFLLTLRTGKRR